MYRKMRLTVRTVVLFHRFFAVSENFSVSLPNFTPSKSYIVGGVAQWI